MRNGWLRRGGADAGLRRGSRIAPPADATGGKRRRLRSALVVASLCAASLGPSGTSAASSGTTSAAQDPTEFEVWVADQGTNQVHVYDRSMRLIDTIDLLPHGVTRPHMIDFDSEHRYAFIANTVSANTAVVRTEDRKVVAVVPTGSGSHMAAVTPDDSAVWVAALGAKRFSEIPLDLDDPEPTFTVKRVIDMEAALAANPFATDYPSAQAVCHQYTADSRYAYLTLGPGAAQGGLVVVDITTAEIVKFFDPAVVNANCGLALTGDGDKMYANWGGDVATGTQGEWFVFDTSSHELLRTGSSRGVDAHGVRLTPDGRSLWMVNRATDNAIVIDPRTDHVVRELPFIGKSPDILDFSPDSRFVFVSLRGPHPLSGPHAIAGETPGVAVLDARSGLLLATVQVPPRYDDSGRLVNDPHGIGVRVLH